MDFVEAKGYNRDKFNNLMIVDGLNLAFRYKYANQKNFSDAYIKTVQSLGTSYQARDIIILGDGGSTYRENIYPEYKASRKEMRKNQTQEEEENFKEFLNEFNNTFNSLSEEGYVTLRYKGVEADDIAAYLVNKYKNDYDHIWLISSDKDWDLLIDKNVSRFSYVTRKEITLDNWSEHYDYPVEDHISIKVLTGDKGDDIPGVDGIGPKRAISLVSTYGCAYDIYSALPIKSKYKHIQNLNTFGDNLLLNYKLMDLLTYCNDALGKAIIKDIEEVFNND